MTTPPNPTDLCRNCGRRYDEHWILNVARFCNIDRTASFQPQPQKDSMPDEPMKPREEECLYCQVNGQVNCPDHKSKATEVTNVAQDLKTILLDLVEDCFADEKAHLELRLIRDAQAPRFESLKQSHPEIYSDFIKARTGPHEVLLRNRRKRVEVLTKLIEQPVLQTAQLQRDLENAKAEIRRLKSLYESAK